METLKDLLDAAKDHGPGHAAWLILLGAVAWIGGYGARVTISHIKGLLDATAIVRLQLQDQAIRQTTRAAELAGQLEAATREAAGLKAALYEASDQLRQSREAAAAATGRADTLTAQYADLSRQHTALQAEMRDTLLALRIAQSTPGGPKA